MKTPPLLVVTSTLFLFALQVLFPLDLQACWWKGLPSQNPNIGGAPLGQGGVDDDKPNQCAFGEPVFVHNGDFVYTHQDLFISARGLGLDITRTYKSQSRFNGRFGLGWELNYNKRVVPLSNGDVFYIDGEARRHRFSYLDGKDYVSPPEVLDKLTQNPDGTYTLTKKDGARYNFSPNGTLSEIIDRNNNQLTFSYNETGNLPIIGVPLYTKDPITPRVIAYQFMLTEVSDSLGRKITFTYDANGRLTKITDFTGRTLTYAYDDFGHLSSFTDPEGATTTYTYDSDRNLREIINPKGEVYLTNTYNPNDQLIAQASGAATTYYSYDTQKKTATRTDANGNLWTYYFNEQDNPIKIIDPQGNISTQTYDANKKMLLTQTTDSQQNSTTYEYDSKGNLIKATDPQGNITNYTYESNWNKLASTTDALGHKTTYAYDTKGNLIKVTDAQGNTTQYTYNEYGELLTVTDSNDNTTTYTYDKYGNLISIADPLDNKITYAYDSLGRRTSITDVLGNTTKYTYNQSDKLIKITYPDDTAEEFQYDCCQLTKRIDANGNEALYDYDIHGQLTKVTDAQGNLTKYSYDSLGNLLTITDAENHTTTNTYDSLGRLIKLTDALGYTTQYFYDTNDNLIKKIDANNQLTEYEYDTLNQLTKIYSGGKDEPAKTMAFSYDNVGNLLAWNDGVYSGAYTYDALNRVKTTATTYPFGEKTISYTYDKVGNKKTLTDAEAGVTTYTYDTLNRLTQVTSPTSEISGYEYDKAGRLTKKTLPNGVYTEYTYNNINQLLILTNKKSDATIISSFSYTHDKVGNRLTMTTPEGTHNYTYDSIYRLTSADHPTQTDETYTYDKVGNRKSSSQYPDWGYDANNRLTSYNGTTFTYDKNGNTLTKSEASGKTTYTYDYEHRLISLKTPQHTAKYTYDPFGKRLSKTVDGVTKYYPYDSEDIIAEYDSSGSLIASYTHGQGIDEPVKGLSPQGTVPEWYYTFDGLGSVSELTDGSQNVAESYKYDAFGKLEIPPAGGNPYTYTGREYDPESGLYFYRARYYDAGAGRFLSEDPVLKLFKSKTRFFHILPLLVFRTQHFNPYIYAYNNPINEIDPEGLGVQTPGCDVIPDFFETNCIRACCDEHDACYEKYDCSVKSWVSCKPIQCAICNMKVTLCFIECIIINPEPAY